MSLLLEFLCVDLHNKCDNVINQCYFIFALWSIIGLDTYCCLSFYGLTLIHLTGPYMDDIWAAYLGYFGFPVVWFGSHFLELFFFRLMLILGFQAWLMLETCRKHCLEQNPFFFMVFRAHLMRFRKLRFILVLPFMLFFV